MAKKNPNPNNVSRKDMDDVFRAQATEPLRKNPKYLDQPIEQMDAKRKKAQDIVDKANAKKKK